MNEVAPFAGSQQSTDLAARLNAFKKTAPKGGDGSVYVKMGKDGVWQFGASSEIVEPEDRWAVNPFSAKSGFICWSTDEDYSGGPLGEIIYDDPAEVPVIGTMARIEDGKWSDQMQISMQCTSDDNKGLDVVFKVNSIGGINAINGLVDAIIAQSSKDPTKIVPVVTLLSDSYKHKKFGKIYTPVLEIVDWMGMDGSSSAEQIEDIGDEVKRMEKSVLDEPQGQEPEQEEAAPVRRRRRNQ